MVNYLPLRTRLVTDYSYRSAYFSHFERNLGRWLTLLPRSTRQAQTVDDGQDLAKLEPCDTI
jgi:hypothetical protein